LEKTLLVCAERCEEMRDCLIAAGCHLTEARSGIEATSIARRQPLDTAVLISTGGDMDLAETVFNLRDLSARMQIIVVAESPELEKNTIWKKLLAHPIPNARILSVKELKSLISPQCQT
jgi:hypothetical protein